MTSSKQPMLSVVVPAYNEAVGIQTFHDSLIKVLQKHYRGDYEIIYIDDGSNDRTYALLVQLATTKAVRIIRLSRNFGKEIATTAGIHAATGQAIITIDADGQHPVELIPAFVDTWRGGKKVVVGLRRSNQAEGFVKRYGSKLFYRLFNKFSGLRLVPGASDFRLINREVQQSFILMTERSRITRGLIDWLGYDRAYIDFDAAARLHGSASYSNSKLIKLAIDSVISLSLSPLYITAYIGAFVLPVSALLGIGMSLDAVFGDPLNLDLTGGAFVMVFVLFLIGILLVSQGIIGLYLSHIHTETKNRPLYVIDAERSK